MSQKHILFITREIVPFYYGGIGTLFKALAKLLRAQGHEVSFLTRTVKGFDHQIFVKHYGDCDIHFFDSPDQGEFVDYSPSGGVVSSFSLAYSLAVADKFAELAPAIKPDVVIAPDFGAEGLLLFIKSFLGYYPDIRFILHVSGSLFHLLSVYEGGVTDRLPSELQEPQNRLVCAMEDCCVLFAREIIVPTHWTWLETHKRLPVERKVHVIPNYPDQDFFKFEETQDQQFGDEPGKLILFIGRLDRCKGADMLLEFYLEHARDLPLDIKLIFIGRDCFCKEYEKSFLEYWQPRIPGELKERIAFLGQVEHSEVKCYLGRASLCVFPSRWEVFGLVCLEAMFYGVPVLVAKNTGPAEVLGEALSDYCFDFISEKKRLASTIQALCAAMDNNEALRRQVRARAIEIVGQAESLYGELVQAGAPEKMVLEEAAKGLVLEKALRAINAINDISFCLGHDAQRLKDYFRLDDETLRPIVRGGCTCNESWLHRLGHWLVRL